MLRPLLKMKMPLKGIYPIPLADRRFGQEVVVLGDQNATESPGAVEDVWIPESLGTIFLGGDNVDAAPSKLLGDSERHLMIHVEPKRHATTPRSRSLLVRSVASGWASKYSFSILSPAAICASISSLWS